MGFFYGRIYTTSPARKSRTTPKVNQQVSKEINLFNGSLFRWGLSSPGDFSKKKSKERDALHVYIVQGFQLTFSPNVTLYYFSSYDVINLLRFCQEHAWGPFVPGGSSAVLLSTVESLTCGSGPTRQ